MNTMRTILVTGLSALGLAACCGPKTDAPEPLRVTLTFDDGLKDHLLVAAPLLEQHGWRGTFNIVTDWIGSEDKLMTWDDVRELIRRGHEVATHCKTHPHLVSLIKAGKADEARREIALSRDAIVSRTGYRPRYMCSPYVQQNEETARICREEGLEQMLPVRRNFGGDNCGDVVKVVDEFIARGEKRLDILHHGITAKGGGWKPFKDREEFARHLDQIAAMEREGKIVVTDYRGMVGESASARGGNGVLLLTFDDPNYDRWVEAIPLFEKYGAHASFFPNGRLDDHALGQLKKLKDAGHTVGIHTLNHGGARAAWEAGKGDEYIAREVKPQLEAYAKIGHTVRAMAYPNNLHSAASDAALSEKCGIRHFRAGHVVRYDPGCKYPKPDLVRTDEVFFPAAELAGKAVLEGIGIGEAYRTDIEEIVACVNRAADRDEVLVTYSHDIRPDAKTINMKTEWLERILATARARGMRIIGFDEIGE